MKQQVAIFWFRRDLRLEDNRGLYESLVWGRNSQIPVLPIFIFDRNILSKLEDKDDLRVQFIHQSLQLIHDRLCEQRRYLRVIHGRPAEVWKKLIDEYSVRAVFTNNDYEPYARERDTQIEDLLKKSQIPFFSFKDQVVFEKSEITKDSGDPYVVYTPYSRRWQQNLTEQSTKRFSSQTNLKYMLESNQPPGMPRLSELGFAEREWEYPKRAIQLPILKSYAEKRNLPAVKGTSQLGLHLRFGTVSIRKLVEIAQEQKSSVWLSELIWREFFMQILWHFPHVVDRSFRAEYDRVQWLNEEAQFQAWCEGKTGYPLVDAGMRELNATGFMHNRVRMVAASFLVKHLLVDWRWGEAYFARKLLDYDMSANNGNWQWVAGSGCDAAPYFRVFNPEEQAKKFDPSSEYIKKWIPEFGTKSYPTPIVEHRFARARVLEAFKKALGKNEKFGEVRG